MNLGGLNRKLALAAIALLLPFPSLGLKTAAMKLPSDFAATAERYPVEGYGGANRGRFEVGLYSGEFTRIESRLALFEARYASNRGKSSFKLRGPGIDGFIEAECSFEQNVATIGIVTFDPEKLTYVCDITRSGTGGAGRLTLGEPRPDGLKQRLLARSIRRGWADFESSRIEIDSVHEYADSRLQAQTPVGYLFSIDSHVGGALELTDVDPTILFDRGLSGPDRLAVLVTALAVSLLRDPADSGLGE
jgi:hypothetical protein